ncbi:MAG: alpha/beta fold hydrolase [Roseburia sp.]
MKKEEFTFMSQAGGVQIHAVKWMPDSGEYRGILQIVHGMIEYIERYEAFARFMTDYGFMVVGHDHIGHGKSVKTNDDWGYFSKEHPCDTVIGDIHTLRKHIQGENEDVPYFMLGHSMGSYMLRRYLVLYPEGLQGAVIMGTGYVSGKDTNLIMNLTKAIARFRGDRYRSSLIKKLTWGKPFRSYDLSGRNLNNSWLTKDTEIVRNYYADPRCTFTFTLNAYLGMFEAVAFDCNQKNVDKMPKSLPVFIVSGADDPVGDWGKGVQKVYDMFREAGMQDVVFQLYQNDRHEILNETDREDVFRDIKEWMFARL